MATTTTVADFRSANFTTTERGVLVDPESATVTPAPSSPTAVSVDNDHVTDENKEFALPPPDGGKDAWLFLGACCIIEMFVWGFPFAFGVLESYYQTHEPFASSGDTAVVGTCALGIMYLDVPIIFMAQRLFPRLTRWAPLIGIAGAAVSLAASSFTQNTTQLIITQGIATGFFGSIAYCPCILYLNEWFVHRKGLAYGIMWAGTGIGGCIFPLALEHLLGHFGLHWTLRIFAMAISVIASPMVLFVKPRVPVTKDTRLEPYKLGFLLQPTFLWYQAASIIESAGYFMPSIYLPTYASSVLGAGASGSVLTVILINLACAIGLFGMGYLTDHAQVTTCILVSTVGAVVGVLLIWGLAMDLAALYVFCIVYGLFAGSYTGTWPGVMKQVVDEADAGASKQYDDKGRVKSNVGDPVIVFAFLVAGRGVGNLISGPLSEALIRGAPWKGQAIGGWGSGCGILIAFTGVTALLGGASFVLKKVGWLQ